MNQDIPSFSRKDLQIKDQGSDLIVKFNDQVGVSLMKRRALRQPIAQLFLACCFCLLAGGCAKTDMDRVSEAQDCLDTSTSTNALTCMDKIDGITTPSSYLIRCAAYFIDQGFQDPARLTQVISQITNTSGNGGSQSIAALAAMGFSASKYTMAQNDQLSADALTACQNSLSGGLIYLASASRIATAALHDIGFIPSSTTPPTPTDVHNALCTNGGPSTTTKAAIGDAASTAYQQNCAGANVTNDVLCQQYQAAVNAGGGNSTAVGGSLINTFCTP
ncbi:MAG: hypothetical protein C5B49_02375 [Bdellovibrio sp.]|nr:MAG: hypothetical protein C5B49_02375 [Bdellovibrio sp.]